MIGTRRATLVRGIGTALVVAALLGACGSDDSSASDDTKADKAAVTAVLTDYFVALGTGDTQGAAALLENGAEHIAEMAHCSDLTAGMAIEVQTVELTDASTATATFDILLNGEVALVGSGGGAVKQDGGWLVSENTFRSLYDAAKDSCTGTPPPPE